MVDFYLRINHPCCLQVITIEAPYPVKEEEENAMHNTVVIFSSNDNFTLKQVFAKEFSFSIKTSKVRECCVHSSE